MTTPQITISELLKRHRQAAELKQKELAKLLGYSDTIVSRIETGKQDPQPEYIEQFIKVLQLDESQRAELLTVYHRQSGGAASSLVPAFSHREDWGEAPDVSVFFGRQAELAELSQWLTTDHCRLVAVLGMGGIGKTSLVTKLAEQIKAEFEYVLWRSLRNAPPLADLLTDCLKFLSDQQRTDLPGEVSAQISLLLEYLRQKRCLLILDNLETILQAETRAGEYREGYAAYGQLVQQVGQGRHQSCLVLTSREKPKELIPLAGTDRPVRTLALPGLGQPDSRALLQDRELHGDESAWAVLTQRYAGNPLALRQVSATIQDLYGGEISAFLKEITTMFGEMRYLLEQQFNRLSRLEQAVMYWLAINREPVSIPELREDLVQPVSAGELAEVMESLLRRSLIEKSAGRFTLQNVIMEYVTDRLIERVCEEIMLGSINLLQSHALMKATAKDYVRESQGRLILGPVIHRLLATFGQKGLEEKLGVIVSALRTESPRKSGYGGGNACNILIHLNSNINGHDFSNLIIRQVYFQGVGLHNVNFAYTDLAKSVFTETFSGVFSVAISPTGEIIAAGTEDGKIGLWSLINGEQFLTCKGHTDWVISVAFSPDGRMLASGGEDQAVRLWDVATGQCLKILRGHTTRVFSVAFSFDSTLLASGSEDQTVRLWDVKTGECLQIIQANGRIKSVKFSPDNKTLATGGTRQVQLWNIVTGQQIKTFEQPTSVMSICFVSEGHVIVSSGGDQVIRFWDLDTGQCIKILHGHTGEVWSVSFNAAGDTLVSGSYDRTIRLWDVQTGQCLKILTGHSALVWSVVFSPDGRMLVSGSEDQTIRLWDVSTGQCIKVIKGYNNQVWSVAFSPSHNILASGGADQILRLWDFTSGKCLKSLQGHTSRIRSVTFHPDGHLLASSADDCTIRLWDVETGQCLKSLQGATSRVRKVVFSPDGTTLVNSGDDEFVRIWDIGTGQVIQIIGPIDRLV